MASPTEMLNWLTSPFFWRKLSDANKATRYKASHSKALVEVSGGKAKDLGFKAKNFGLKAKAEA